MSRAGGKADGGSDMWENEIDIKAPAGKGL
jgi:hypothetical protein